MTQAANLAALGSNINSSGIAQAAGGGTAGTAGVTGFKNRLINGSFAISQYNGSSSITPGSNTYIIDRWRYPASQASKFTFQQNQGSVTPPAGFTYYAGFTSSSAFSLGTSDYFGFNQFVEGYNMADLAWGTANAKTITLSFWARSSLTGTFGGAIRTGDSSNYSYPFTYSLPSANTWTYCTITILGPTAGTWNTTNGQGLDVWFSLGTGSTFSGTASTWAAANYVNATGSVNVVSTNAATWYVTGVQLEVGSAATNFDVRSYTTEQQLCYRYFYTIVNQAPVGSSIEYCAASFYSATELNATAIFPVSMRTSPSIVQTSGTNYHYVDKSGTALQFNSWTGMTRAGPNSALLYLPSLSGYVAGYGTNIYSYNNSTFVAASAEL